MTVKPLRQVMTKDKNRTIEKPQGSKKEDLSFDTCVIRTHAPEGIALAGQRVNHSAKVP